MASVPLYPSGGTAAPAQLPGPSFSGGSPANFGAIGAQQGVELGAQVENFAREQVMLQNQVRVNDAINQVRQRALDLTYDPQGGFLSQTGRNALDRASGQALPDEYGGKLEQAATQFGADLTPEQQRVFQQQVSPLLTSFHGDVMRHTLQESRAYALSVQDSTIKLASDQAAQHWDDPDAINGTVDAQGNRVGGLVQQAKAAVYASSKLTGMDAQAAMLAAGSAVHRRVIDAALENGNPTYAQSYLQRFSGDMTADDILHVQGRVNSQAEASIAILATEKTRKEFESTSSPTDLDRLSTLVGLVSNAESRSRDFTDTGAPVTSKAGAMYAMQVLQSTARNPGYGIKPADETGTPQQVADEYNRVGRQKLSYLLQHFGNVPAALAAYNVGEKVVEKAISDAQSTGEPAATGLWLQDPAIPKETRDYVTGIMSKYSAGAGAQPLPTKQQFVDAALAKIGPNPRPQTLQLTTQRAEQQFELMTQARTQQGNDAEKAAQQALIANGGDYAALQREHPELLSAVASLDPGRYDNLLTFAKNLSKGDRTDNMEAYAEAWGHPDEMAKMPEPMFTAFIHGNFTDATGKELVKRLEDWREGKVDGGVGAVNDAALKQSLNDRLTNLGLVWEGPKASKDNKAAYGTVAKYLRDGIFEAQRNLGRKMTPEEVGQFVDTQFQRTEPQKRWFGLLADKSAPALTMGYSDVPTNVRTAIDTKMPGASEGDKLRAYWIWKQNQSRGAQVAGQ